VLSAADGLGVSILLTLPGTSNIEIGVKPGSIISLHASAQGKVALAFGTEDLLRGIMQKRLQTYTPDTITDPLRLVAELAAIRKQGWAAAPNQAIVGLNAVAAPLFDSGGKYCASLAFVDSIQYLSAEPNSELTDALVQAARKLSADIGYRSLEK
jgi:IclR family KDG regulon transcriptional repressor